MDKQKEIQEKIEKAFGASKKFLEEYHNKKLQIIEQHTKPVFDNRFILHPKQIMQEDWNLSNWLPLFEYHNVPHIKSTWNGYTHLGYTLHKIFSNKPELLKDGSPYYNEHIEIIEKYYPSVVKVSKDFIKNKNFGINNNALIRFGNISPGDIKLALSNGKNLLDGNNKVKKNYSKFPYIPGDIRMEDTFYKEYKLFELGIVSVIPVMFRPYVELKKIDNYPLEFRVFIKGNKGIIGVCNYYVQRELNIDEHPEYKKYYEEVVEFINEHRYVFEQMGDICIDVVYDINDKLLLVDTNPSVFTGTVDPAGFLLMNQRSAADGRELYSKFINVMKETNKCIFDYDYHKGSNNE